MSRVAVVTGGASGIGLAVSQRLAARGDKVAVLDLQGETARQTAKSLQGQGLNALGLAVDVSDRDEVDTAMQAVRDAFGPIEILVTSAGVTSLCPFTEISLEKWNLLLAVNLTGTFNCAQNVIPDMVEASWGRIVTISSVAGQAGSANQADYVASKSGLIGLTKALAKEFAPRGITVNTIPPGLVDTPMARAAEAAGTLPGLDVVGAAMPLRRAGTPQDIAAACAFLCSDDGSYITGQQIGVNGGTYM
ncbi:3-oxoacyl-ACP reductase FabG [Frankia sp. CNm7]|uniref:3-oxoacyl-ACP reductase FabG n=1 Tax=Frankia nepalensis TaxID=1836974 RepID=A0A937UJH9_9ACTN|nr:3-oxoacyl-ACP reductase FabG [Frankia nepalensis]MBL7502492.1 3-oxoacyl-ACP reductase FabG [Frankia nepalensis]MBL7516436.1 3-oxoacyl-ACP reductase FabG [Frankia nepalensis]MBL7518024.1 3-oxoacyl-ACP reductase FabG [Frankia nepalensis]MBL7625814.1 3-oxoacyl-ACP reductase FabG [Frankia nepalensis]